MANLYEILADAQSGEAMTASLVANLGFRRSKPKRAVAALLPAISMGLKRTTATPEGLGDLLAVDGSSARALRDVRRPTSCVLPRRTGCR